VVGQPQLRLCRYSERPTFFSNIAERVQAVKKKGTLQTKKAGRPAPKQGLVAVRQAAQKPVHAKRSDIQRAVRAVSGMLRTAGA